MLLLGLDALGLKARVNNKGEFPPCGVGDSSSPRHNLCWGKFVHLENLLFTCFLLKIIDAYYQFISSSFDWCAKPESINVSNTELQNKHDQQTVCRSLLSVLQPTWRFCCQANSKAPKVGHVFPYATCNNHSGLLFSLWTDPLWSRCYSKFKLYVGVDA